MVFVKVPREVDLYWRRVIGGNVKKARVENKLSLKKVSEYTGVAESKLCEMEKGDKSIPSELLHQLGELYLVSPAYFFSGVESGIEEERLFNFNRASQKIWAHATQQYALAVFQTMTVAMHGQDMSAELLEAVGHLLAQAERMIELNQDDAWQQMRGGTLFVTELNRVKKKYQRALLVHSNAQHMAKKAKEQVQLELFL